MPKYRIADLLIEITPHYDLLARVCEKYCVETEAAPDFSIDITEQQIDEVISRFPDYTRRYAENLCACRHACNEAARRGAILFHAAAVMVEGKAYAFSAPSGTGKSTHILLWRKRYGKLVEMINGDKPFLRERDGVFTVYGSPWCGKEGWNKNVSAPLAGLCFLSRDKENSITPMDADEALPRVFTQMIKPPTAEGVAETMRTADSLIRNVPIYHLRCNMTEAAAECSFRALTGKTL